MPSAIRVVTRLQDQDDVSLTSLASDDFIKWDGSNFINRTPAQVLSDIGAVDVTGDTMTGALSVPGAGANSERFGAAATAAGDNSTVLGNAASAAGVQNLAVGRLASAGSGTGHVVLGYNASIPDGLNSGVAIGAGVTGSHIGVAIGAGVTTGTGSTAVGRNASAAGGGNVAIGQSAVADGARSLAIGETAVANGNDDVAIGRNASAGGNSVAIGSGAQTTATQAIAIGQSTTASALYSVAIGLFNTASHQGSILLARSGATTKANQFMLGSSAIPINEVFTYTTTALTSTIQDIYIANHKSSGTPAAGFGVGHLFQLESSTTEDQDAARIAAEWNVATDASREADLVLSAYEQATEREGLRIRGSGSGAQIGFLGAAPQAAPTYTPTNVSTDRSYDADTANVNEVADVLGTLIADLQAFGLLA